MSWDLNPTDGANSKKVKRYHTKDYYQLKKEMECLIEEGHLKKYVKGDSTQRQKNSYS